MNLNNPRWWLDRINRGLKCINLRLDSLTASRAESRRLADADQRQWFTRAVYPVPASFRSAFRQTLLSELTQHRVRFKSFLRATDNDVGYQFENPYFTSPDAEILYTIMRRLKPRRVLEIGCGHSTKVIHQAIKDGGFPCEHTCIDPHPRQDVSRLADVVIAKRIETMAVDELAGRLAAGDVLFIDTSHEVKAANDVAFIYGCLLPAIVPGVVVHIHDIFLPYEYPYEWVTELGYDWAELHVVQVMLTMSDHWEVLWPGYYLQRTMPDFNAHFTDVRGHFAQSLWLRKLK